jgi:dTMP kinase
VLLDVEPGLGLGRFETQDRIEAESHAFHNRVRESFLALAKDDPDHYLVVDAGLPADVIAAKVRERLTASLPLATKHLGAVDR